MFFKYFAGIKKQKNVYFDFDLVCLSLPDLLMIDIKVVGGDFFFGIFKLQIYKRSLFWESNINSQFFRHKVVKHSFKPNAFDLKKMIQFGKIVFILLLGSVYCDFTHYKEWDKVTKFNDFQTIGPPRVVGKFLQILPFFCCFLLIF